MSKQPTSQELRDKHRKTPLIAKIRKEALAQWKGTCLSYENMTPECRVAFLMGRLHELEKDKS